MIDPATVGTIERIFDLVEAGASFGDMARKLNAEGSYRPTRQAVDQPGDPQSAARGSQARAVVGPPAVGCLYLLNGIWVEGGGED